MISGEWRQAIGRQEAVIKSLAGRWVEDITMMIIYLLNKFIYQNFEKTFCSK